MLHNLDHLYFASGSLSFSDSRADRENARSGMQLAVQASQRLSEELEMPGVKDILQRFDPLFSDVDLPKEERLKRRQDFWLAIDLEIRTSWGVSRE